MYNKGTVMKSYFKKFYIPLILFFAYEYVFGLIISKADQYGGHGFIYIFQTGRILIILGFLLISYFLYGFKINSIDMSHKMKFYKSVLFSVMVFIIAFFVEGYINSLKELIFVDIKSYVNINENRISHYEGVNRVITNFGSVIIAPIIEELFYRQILFGTLYDLHEGCNKYVRLLTTALISSIVFSFAHDGFSHYTINYMFSGIICSGVYFYTKRISSAIIVHGLFNLISILL